MEIDHLRKLVELMVENDLSRIELREGETHILLRRGQPVITAASLPPAGNPLPAVAAAAPAPAVGAAAPTVPIAPDNEILIRSPMVGTFYVSPDPESPPYVSIGSSVQPNTVVCLIEAMKVFNELKAEVSGQITRVLVKNGQAVEFDQPLFAVLPA